MQKTEWMKQVVRIGKDFHVRQQSPLKHNILNIFCAILIWSLCVGCFWSSLSFVATCDYVDCLGLVFRHFIWSSTKLHIIFLIASMQKDQENQSNDRYFAFFFYRICIALGKGPHHTPFVSL